MRPILRGCQRAVSSSQNILRKLRPRPSLLTPARFESCVVIGNSALGGFRLHKGSNRNVSVARFIVSSRVDMNAIRGADTPRHIDNINVFRSLLVNSHGTLFSILRTMMAARQAQ